MLYLVVCAIGSFFAARLLAGIVSQNRALAFNKETAMSIRKSRRYRQCGILLSAASVLSSSAAYAQLDRGGNMINESGSRSSSGGAFVLLAISGGLAWFIYGWLKNKYPSNSTALNVNIAIWAAMIGVFGAAMLLKG